jgi:hypothetical protein
MPIVSSKMKSSIPLGRNCKPTRSLNVMGSTILLVILTDGMVSGGSRGFNCCQQETLVIYFGSSNACDIFRFVRVWTMRARDDGQK